MTDLLTSRGNCTSASNALPDSLCPGRHQASLGLPEQSTPEADSGTRIHEFLACKNQPLEVEELEIAIKLRDKTEQLRDDFLAREGKAYNEYSSFIEHRMWLVNPVHSGQVDLLIAAGKTALLCDYKTGFGDIPDSDTNLQLRDLAVLTWRNFPKIKSVEVAIIDRFTEPVVTRYELEDLRRAEKELKARVKASNAKNPRRIPGPIQCKFCRAFGTERCKESTALVTTLQRNLVPDLVITGNGMQGLLPHSLVRIQKLKPLVTKLCDQVTAEIRRRLKEDPSSVPGASLAKPKVLKPIVDPDTVFERAMALGAPRKAIMAAVKMTKGPLEDCVREATGLGGKELGQKMEEILAGCTEEKPCEPEVEVE